MTINERNYYVICDDNCRFPSMTSEQILEAIAEATGETPTHIDDAFITKIKEQNRNGQLKLWVGTNAEYNAIETPDNDVLYIITDASEYGDIESRIESAEGRLDTAEGKIRSVESDLINKAIVYMDVDAIQTMLEGTYDLTAETGVSYSFYQIRKTFSAVPLRCGIAFELEATPHNNIVGKKYWINYSFRIRPKNKSACIVKEGTLTGEVLNVRNAGDIATHFSIYEGVFDPTRFSLGFFDVECSLWIRYEENPADFDCWDAKLKYYLYDPIANS